ncbi:hypothetical protein A167_01594 [Alcanivorax sp. S71-1-4]|uniref:transposase n=1 Tax=Alcanivorax sp. S71-1-4 TaxID=1177159 RepID=UPI00135A64C7|nr:transposase [Alcanivorax sp. S71-1-4]KAF0809523.1 hypothetical protein A167_01594 [Alcanivorax sp. S71-1-4]
MARYSRVGMQELDQKLSRIVESARVSPVSVFRYGSPWVWIVSQEEWQKTLTDIRDYLPMEHPLITLRDAVPESGLVEQVTAMAGQDLFRLDMAALTHIMLLRLAVTHAGSDADLYHQINYNMLYRWFVGLDINRRIWSRDDFIRDVSVFGDRVELIAVIKGFLDKRGFARSGA